MSTTTNNKPPIWYWIVSVVALVWNGMGANIYLQQAYNTESYRAMYSEEELEIAANLPAFVTAAFAIAVFAGVIGALLLLFRNKLASPFFVLSLIGILVQMGYTIINGYTSNIAITITTIVLGIVLVWFARMSVAKGWAK